MEFGLLGPLVVCRDGAAVEIGAPKQRALLVYLLLRAGQTASVDRLIDALWEDAPPAQARVTLRSYVSSLRRALGHDDEPVLVTRGSGYSLQIPPEAIDTFRFQQLVTAARKAQGAGDPQTALEHLDEALGLWRGDPLADLADSRFASGERARLEELRLAAQEDRLDALLALGRHQEAVAVLEAFTAAEPLRERAQAQLMVGLYRAGRAPDALVTFRQFRGRLADELGLDPSARLQQLADRILNQDADLDLPVRTAQARRSRAAAVGPLVGRDDERGELRASVERLLDGDGDLLLLAGEPGIGKTALLEELARMAEDAGAAVHWGRCQETRGAPPFWPWIQVLRTIATGRDAADLQALTAGTAGGVTQLVAEIAERVGGRRAVPEDDLEAARFHLYEAVAVFLRRAADGRPLVVLLDDLHWADTSSLQLLAHLVRQRDSGRLLVAGAYRDVRSDWAEELEATLAAVVREPSTHQLGLRGLTPRGVADVSAALTGRPLSDEEADRLHQRTGGNPFFVRQLARLPHEEGPDLDTVPTGVRHVIGLRLSPLPPDVQDTLEVAAVLGAQFDLRRLAAAARSSPPEALRAAADAAEHGLLEAVGRPAQAYRFVHALVREAVYDRLTPERASRLHAQAAAALEALPGAPAAELAEHLWQAADVVGDERPVRALTAAADEALAVFAYEQAESAFRRALRLAVRAGEPARELAVRIRLLQLLISLHGWAAESVREVADPAVQLARSTRLSPDIVPFWLALPSIYATNGDLATARGLAEELLAKAHEAKEPGALAAGYSALAYVELVVGRDPAAVLDHLASAEHYVPLAPPEHLQATPHISVGTICMRAVALAYLGDREGAIVAARRALDKASRVADPLSQGIAHMIAALVGVLVENPAFAAETAQSGLALCEAHGLRFIGHLLTANLCWASAHLGEDAAVQADRLHGAVDAIARSGHTDPRAKYLLFAAETYLLADDPGTAATCLEQARRLAGETQEYLPADRLQRAEEAVRRREDSATRRSQ